MTAIDRVSPRGVLAIILGASIWPHASLQGSKAFTNSAAAFKDYLTLQFGLPSANILDLFDDERAPSDIDKDISHFLQARSQELETARTPARDLLLYYVGH